jgi:hypothetical protein
MTPLYKKNLREQKFISPWLLAKSSQRFDPPSPGWSASLVCLARVTISESKKTYVSKSKILTRQPNQTDLGGGLENRLLSSLTVMWSTFSGYDFLKVFETRQTNIKNAENGRR